MREIDSAHSRSMKTLPWPWFREGIGVLKRKSNIFGFLWENRRFLGFSRRGIGCAHSQTVKTLPWPWFREGIGVLKRKSIYLRKESYTVQIANFILSNRLPPVGKLEVPHPSLQKREDALFVHLNTENIPFLRARYVKNRCVKTIDRTKKRSIAKNVWPRFNKMIFIFLIWIVFDLFFVINDENIWIYMIFTRKMLYIIKTIYNNI